ncbi:MAG: DUF6259 domain-containing protein [Acidobacteriota bacterium]
MKARTSLALLLLACAPAMLPAPADPAAGLVLANRHVRFEFEPSSMGLKSMLDLATGKDHIQPAAAGKHLLWRLDMARGARSAILDNNEKPCTYARLDTLAGGAQRAVLEWNGLRYWKEDRALNVRVTIELPADSGIALWRISVENHSDYWGLKSVAFPVASGFPASGAYDIARPVFASGGSLLRKRTEPVGDRHPSGFWPMQFCSLHLGNDSVYLGTRDSEGRAKNFLIEPGKQTSVIHHPENMNDAGSGWQDYYPVEFGVFQGSWVEAARHYRDWALKQKWAGAGPLSARAVPAKAKDAAFWLRDRWLPGKSPDGTDVPAGITPLELNRPLIAALDEMGVPAGLHWYNWHQVPYDNLYPHFLPAKQGFAERVKQLVERGVLVMPYINGCSADMNIPDWEKFKPYANTDEQGGFRLHFYSETAGRLLTMCPAQTFWQSTMERLADDMFSTLDINALYVDQISAMEPEPCFNPAHGHPKGGGRYWTDGNREVLRRIRNAALRHGRDVALTSEGFDEMFLDLLDSNLTWAQPSADEIPLMQLVYSGYTLFFGSPCDYNRSETFFRYAQGQALIDGRQNGWMDAGLFDGKHAAKVRYLKDCVRARAAYGKYLTYGRLLEPVLPLDKLPVFSEKAFGWKRNEPGTAPVAEARLWQAEDGARAIFFANYSDTRVPFRYRLAKGAERTEVLEPASIKVVELR